MKDIAPGIEFKQLFITQSSYGEDKKLSGSLEVSAKEGDIKLKLTPELIEKIMDVAADSLVSAASEVADQLRVAAAAALLKDNGK